MTTVDYLIAEEKALEWCKNNPGWKRISDLEDNVMYWEPWDELPQSRKIALALVWGNNAPKIWEVFTKKYFKVPFGFITNSGEFIENKTAGGLVKVIKADELYHYKI